MLAVWMDGLGIQKVSRLGMAMAAVQVGSRKVESYEITWLLPPQVKLDRLN
jgi:hypothetical protein